MNLKNLLSLLTKINLPFNIGVERYNNSSFLGRYGTNIYETVSAVGKTMAWGYKNNDFFNARDIITMYVHYNPPRKKIRNWFESSVKKSEIEMFKFLIDNCV